jgi:hypothetical protein
MSVGDNKGSRRRFKVRQILGHAPRPKGRSVAEGIQREREKALRMAKASA